jgi:hypothetical protein
MSYWKAIGKCRRQVAGTACRLRLLTRIRADLGAGPFQRQDLLGLIDSRF